MIILAVGIAVLLLAKRNLIRQAAMLAAWGSLLAIIVDSGRTAGLYSVSWTLFPVTLMVACWWLNTRMLIALGIVCIAAVACFYGVHVYGQFSPVPSAVSTVATRLIAIFTAALLIGLTIARHLRNELHRANAAKDEFRRLSEIAEHARLAAEQANSAKSLFLRNMSHELRTPLHGMLSFGHLGVKRTGSAQTPEISKLNGYFSRITESGERLQRLLDDVLTLTDLQSGVSTLNISPAALDVLIRNAVDAWEKKNPGQPPIAVEVATGTFDTRCDWERLTDVCRRLFDNAARYAPLSPISVCVERAGTEVPGCEHWIRCRVSDHGPGIPASERTQVFEAFSEHSAKISDAGGRGLGLAICAGFIRAHGGAIRAAEAQGGGCEIIFLLPAEKGVDTAR